MAAQIKTRATMSRARRGSILRKNTAIVSPLNRRIKRIMAIPTINPKILVII
jgi:hypothetical protein